MELRKNILLINWHSTDGLGQLFFFFPVVDNTNYVEDSFKSKTKKGCFKNIRTQFFMLKNNSCKKYTYSIMSNKTILSSPALVHFSFSS